MNFDSTVVGQPYSKVNRIGITYTAPNTAHVEVVNQHYVLLTDASRVSIGAEETLQFDVSPSDMATEIPLVSPDNGDLLGANITYGQVLLGILAAIRAHQ